MASRYRFIIKLHRKPCFCTKLHQKSGTLFIRHGVLVSKKFLHGSVISETCCDNSVSREEDKPFLFWVGTFARGAGWKGTWECMPGMLLLKVLPSEANLLGVEVHGYRKSLLSLNQFTLLHRLSLFYSSKFLHTYLDYHTWWSRWKVSTFTCIQKRWKFSSSLGSKILI